MKHPGEIDDRLVNAQQARRLLDRIVGYQVSPLLWDKVRRGLSAGRVQSVAVRLITERERAIRAFIKEEYWTIAAALEGDTPPPFNANLFELAGKRLDHKTFRLENEAAATGVVEHLKGADWVVAKVEKSDRKRNPSPPFITSRLQQEAARKLGYQPRRTMGIAQKLYEGVEIGDEGAVGLISYMRTDSTRLSPDAVEAVRGYIATRYGADYVPEKPPVFKSKKNTQDAHEAIRPTSIEFPPERVAPYLEKDELNLYTLIWNRFVACQMEPARLKATTIDIKAKDATFRATGQVVVFDGFMRVYTEGVDEATPDDEAERTLPDLKEGDRLRLQGELKPEQHFTQPPPRFSQATLIKELEENGIGRPSTYASIMQTILGKEYVQEDPQRRLFPTELGMLVTDLLVGSFPDILNVDFTAGMEEDLDGIEEGTQNWVEVMRRFYEPFAKDLGKAETEMRNVKAEERPTDIKCDQCGETMVIKWGRRGEFLACRSYPECKSTKNFTRDENGDILIAKAETTDEVCEKCGKPMLVRFGRFGKFLGCSGYPECKTITPLIKPAKLGVACPDCGGAASADGVGGEILEKRSRRGKIFYSCNRYPDCKFASWDRPIPMPCPLCKAPFVVEKTTKRAGTVRRCLKEGCDFQETAGEISEVAS
jgi:DNA topoisomerase-1